MQVAILSVDVIDEPLIIVRENLETEDFRDLVADVKAHGVEVPIIVRAIDSRFRVVDGYRRWRAARAAGRLEVPCEVRDMTDAEEIALLMRVALHRKDFTALEEGKMFATMHEGLHLTYEGIAEEVGKSVGYVTDRLILVRGPLDVREAVAAEEISPSVALQLMRVEHDGDRQYLLYWARTQGYTVTEARRLVQERLAARAIQPAAPPPATAAESYGTPPVALALCEWHMAPAPLNSLLSLRVCPLCHHQLELIRERLKIQDRMVEGGGNDVPGA